MNKTRIYIKYSIILMFFLLFEIIVPGKYSATLYAQPLPGSYYDLLKEMEDKPVGFNPTTLIIYRPQNKGEINDIRCWLKLEDEEGNDVTYTACKARYQWVTDNMKSPQSIPVSTELYKYEGYQYKKTYYLSGAMAMHLTLKKGRYKISVYTPVDKQQMFTYPQTDTEPFEWKSNIFIYDTTNPANVLFVSPTVNENGFYNGGWLIDYKAPRYFNQTVVPELPESSNN